MNKLEKELNDLSIDFENDKDKKYYFTHEDPDEVLDAKFFQNPIEKCQSNPNSKIGYAYHPDMELHKAPASHCERPERVRAIDYHLDKTKLKSYLKHITVEEVNPKHIEYVHNSEYV